MEDIAADVLAELDFIDVEDLWERSGSTCDGYIEPGKDAWAMLEEAIRIGRFSNEFTPFHPEDNMPVHRAEGWWGKIIEKIPSVLEKAQREWLFEERIVRKVTLSKFTGYIE